MLTLVPNSPLGQTVLGSSYLFRRRGVEVVLFLDLVSLMFEEDYSLVNFLRSSRPIDQDLELLLPWWVD